SQLPEALGELSTLGALADMGVPAAHLGDRQLQPHARPHQPGDILEALAERSSAVLRPVVWRELGELGRTRPTERPKGLYPGRAQGGVHRLRIESVERRRPA